MKRCLRGASVLCALVAVHTDLYELDRGSDPRLPLTSSIGAAELLLEAGTTYLCSRTGIPHIYKLILIDYCSWGYARDFEREAGMNRDPRGGYRELAEL